MPDMTDGNGNKVVEWYKQTGDIIKRNDIMCDIETPDFTSGMVTEDEFDSIMGADIFVKEGPEFVNNGTVICKCMASSRTWRRKPSQERISFLDKHC